MIRNIMIAAMALVVGGCGSCRCRRGPAAPDAVVPAGPRERAVLDALITGEITPEAQLKPGVELYDDVVAELEKQPQSALRAVRERTAPPLTREALMLGVLERRLADPRKHRELVDYMHSKMLAVTRAGTTYPSEIAGLTGDFASAVWAEVLVKGDNVAARAAIAHLDRIGDPFSLDAIATVAADTDEAVSPGYAAAEALGNRGDVARLMAALQRWEGARGRYNEPAPLVGFDKLPAAARPKANAAIVAALEAADATPSRRSLLLRAIALSGDAAAIERLTTMRQTTWGEAQKAEIDAAIEAIVRREAKAP